MRKDDEESETDEADESEAEEVADGATEDEESSAEQQEVDMAPGLSAISRLVKEEGKCVILVAPAGFGKTSVCRELVARANACGDDDWIFLPVSKVVQSTSCAFPPPLIF